MVGFNKDNQREATRIIHEAIDRGVNFLDTADIYSFWSSKSYAG